MASKIGSLAFASLILAIYLQYSSAETIHQIEWLIPTNNTVYSSLAARQTFLAGDTLVFNFAANQHNVADVSKSAYDTCRTTATANGSTPVRIALQWPGERYFICTVGQHCSLGQKLHIKVVEESAPSPSPTSSSPAAPSPRSSGDATPGTTIAPTADAPSSPAANGASQLASVAGMLAGGFAIAGALWYL